MEITQYYHLRECELETALAETKADIAADRFNKGTAAAHVKRVKKTAALLSNIRDVWGGP